MEKSILKFLPFSTSKKKLHEIIFYYLLFGFILFRLRTSSSSYQLPGNSQRWNRKRFTESTAWTRAHHSPGFSNRNNCLPGNFFSHYKSIWFIHCFHGNRNSLNRNFFFHQLERRSILS